MLNIFLSYARADLAPVLAIEQGCARLAFLFGGIKISSTVAKGGQRWPKTLGEAIAARDYLLLCWSKSPRRLGVRYKSQHVAAVGFTLGFLHHPTYDWMVE
jgi:hypothetical protein